MVTLSVTKNPPPELYLGQNSTDICTRLLSSVTRQYLHPLALSLHMFDLAEYAPHQMPVLEVEHR